MSFKAVTPVKAIRLSLSLLLALSLLFTFASSASAAAQDQIDAAVARMDALGLANLNPIDPGLNANLTRAELAAIVVRSFGMEEEAQLVKGAPTGFEDVDGSGHWASGYIAILKSLFEQQGYALGNGTLFDPNGSATPTAVLNFAFRPMGAMHNSTDAFAVALDNGILPEEEAASLQSTANLPITRGMAIYVLDAIFSRYEVSPGKTMYTTYIDTVAPQIAVSPTVPASTSEISVTITGEVPGDTTSVQVDGTEAQLTDGIFSAAVSLTPGQVNNFVITAVDLAGNIAELPLSITHTGGNTGWNPDRNGDGKIDLYDIVRIAKDTPGDLPLIVPHYLQAVQAHFPH